MSALPVTINPPSKGNVVKTVLIAIHKQKSMLKKMSSQHQELKLCVSCHEEKVDFTIPKRSPISSQKNLIELFK